MSETSDNADTILFLLKTRGPTTAQGLAHELGMSMEGARQHLLGLKDSGLVLPEDRRHGRGRPKRFWKLSAAGHGRFPDTHSQLTLEMIDAIRDEFGEQGLDRLIERRERQCLRHYQDALERCKSLRAKVKKLAELRSREGYMASWESDNANGYLLIENHCPICAAARGCQGFCRSELEVFGHALGDTVKVERSEHLLAGARRCVYRIRPVGLADN